MAKDVDTGIIGISIRDTALRMSEASRVNGEYKITHIAQGRVRTPFVFSSLKDASLIHKYAEDINRLYETSNFQARRAVFTLDSSMVLIKRIPVDVSLKGQRLKDHVCWEVEQCVINPLEEYIIDFEHVPPTEEQEFAEVIVVVVRRAAVEFLKAVFKNTDLRLSAIEVDVFAAHRVLLSNYDSLEDAYTALIDIRKENLQFAILKNKEFYMAQEVDYSLEEQGALQNTDESYLSRILSKELRRIILDNKIGKSVDDMQAIYLYGENISPQVVGALQNIHRIRIDLANPFRRIKIVDETMAPEIQNNPETFVVSVGAALKNL
ncbi:pilus assembly protein PilM [candidate division KSB1 bacterium]|nr:pilus assembly protein PilM [candidate division KSB1 bacterium]